MDASKCRCLTISDVSFLGLGSEPEILVSFHLFSLNLLLSNNVFPPHNPNSILGTFQWPVL
jgi:hypothetical protein